jgi:hypothetical protein
MTCALIAPEVTSFGTPTPVMAAASNGDPAVLFAQICVQMVEAEALSGARPPHDDGFANGASTSVRVHTRFAFR